MYELREILCQLVSLLTETIRAWAHKNIFQNDNELLYWMEYTRYEIYPEQTTFHLTHLSQILAAAQNMAEVQWSRTGHGDVQLSGWEIWGKHCVPYFFILCVLQDKNTALLRACNILQIPSRYMLQSQQHLAAKFIMMMTLIINSPGVARCSPGCSTNTNGIH